MQEHCFVCHLGFRQAITLDNVSVPGTGILISNLVTGAKSLFQKELCLEQFKEVSPLLQVALKSGKKKM